MGRISTSMDSLETLGEGGEKDSDATSTGGLPLINATTNSF